MEALRNNALEARILTITKQDHGKPYLVAIQCGPGQRLPTGAIKPMSITAQASIMLDDDVAVKLALAIRDTVLAFFTTQYDAIKTARTPRYDRQTPAAPPNTSSDTSPVGRAAAGD